MGAEEFGSRLKALREAAGLSQKGLAEKAGLVTSAIGHLEQGLRKPTWETVLALAGALGVSCAAFEAQETGDSQDAPSTPAPRRPGRPRKVTDATAAVEVPDQVGTPPKGKTAGESPPPQRKPARRKPKPRGG